MKCEFCHEEEATIHLAQVIEKETKQLNICQTCAQKQGIDLNSPISVTEVLFGLGNKPEENGVQTHLPAFDISCSRCQMTRAEFKKHARLGCPACYTTFLGELSALIQVMHHSRQHVGKIPCRQGKEAHLTAKISALQKNIKAAISMEAYEEAARLRDEIKLLQKDVYTSSNKGKKP